MYPDHEFDPITPEEEAQRAQEAEFARRVRREVLRIERGEAEEEIRADLERSGLFKMVELGPSPMGADAPPDFGRVRSRGADAFAVGTVAPSGSGRYQVQFRLFDAAKQVSLGGQAIPLTVREYHVLYALLLRT